MDISKDYRHSRQNLRAALNDVVQPYNIWNHSPKIGNLLLAILLLIICLGCKIHRTEKSFSPDVSPPGAFQYTSKPSARYSEPWWKTFDSSELNDLMDVALKKNLDVRSSWNRLAQASAIYVINRAGQLPALRFNSGASITQTTDKEPLSASQEFINIAESLGVPVVDGDLKTENIIVGGGLSYELDIWRRINSLKASARFNLSATFQDIQATAFLVSASVVDAWLSIRQQVELLKLVHEQLASNRTQLELLELRLSVGQATALDVLQQRQQVAATEAAIPALASVLDTEQNRLQILLGQIPMQGLVSTNAVTLPEFIQLPDIGAPIDLLNSRPDLRAAKARIEAADQDVAVAVADRLPRLTLNLNYDFQATEFAGPFNRQITSVLGNLTGPIFEGGRRKAEVKRRQEILKERINRYTQLFLNALLEVENALVQERRQNELIFAMEKQIAHALRSLEEARARFVNGLNDYLPVLTSLQTTQALERNLVIERRRRLTFRSNLLRAIGGVLPESLLSQSPQTSK